MGLAAMTVWVAWGGATESMDRAGGWGEMGIWSGAGVPEARSSCLALCRRPHRRRRTYRRSSARGSCTSSSRRPGPADIHDKKRDDEILKHNGKTYCAFSDDIQTAIQPG